MVTWIVVAGVVLVVGGIGFALLGPTVRTFFGPSFEPAPKDDASVTNAVLPRTIDGGGVG